MFVEYFCSTVNFSMLFFRQMMNYYDPGLNSQATFISDDLVVLPRLLFVTVQTYLDKS